MKRRRIVRRWERYEWDGEPWKRWTERAERETYPELWDIPRRPIPPIYDETEKERKMRKTINVQFAEIREPQVPDFEERCFHWHDAPSGTRVSSGPRW